VVFHQAGQPGVRKSWSTGFNDYCEHNVKATQRLLEAAKAAATPRFVYASSSSVYGNAPAYPTGDRSAPARSAPTG
jgi:UDP-glucuronate 4-epimerase